MIFNTNPYIIGTPARGKAYVGRTDALQNVLHILKSPSENAMVFCGQPCIGKTSLLGELAAKLPHEGAYATVYFDLQDKTALSLKEILWDMAKQILYTLDIPPLKNPGSDLSKTFQTDFIPHVLSQFSEETVLVLLFDEFHASDNTAGKQAEAAFFSYLREMMSLDSKRIQFVFTAGQSENVSDRYTVLFGGLKIYPVPLLSAEETLEVVHLSKQNVSLGWPDDISDQIWELTGGHPYLTQQFCHLIWERLYDRDPEEVPEVSAGDMEAVIPECLEITGHALEALWKDLGTDEHKLLSALAESDIQAVTRDELERCLWKNGLLDKSFTETLERLEKQELICREDNRYHIRAGILRSWILQQTSLSNFQADSSQTTDSAEFLFNAALDFYQEDRFEEAALMLQRMIRNYPDHLKANHLLAEIFLIQGNTQEALKRLEFLYEHDPLASCSRLIQILFIEAQEKTHKDEQRLAFYKRILEVDPEQSEAMSEYRRIYERHGDTAYNNNEFEEALKIYEEIGAAEKIRNATQKIHLNNLYYQALDALEAKDRAKARDLLAQVLSSDPLFREAALYMHLAASQTECGIELENLIAADSENPDDDKESQDINGIIQSPAPRRIWENFKTIRDKFSKFRQKFKSITGEGQVGPYKLICPVARGGMSDLFLAVNEKGEFRRTVIIKKVLPRFTENSQFISMFNQEARLAALLYHPNIVQIIDFYEENNAIIMEYIRGRNLAQIARKIRTAFPVDQALFVASKICEGLHHAHSRKDEQTREPLNIVHRDVKPSNILVSFNGEVKITDFGISKANSDTGTDVAGEVRGTLAYMAPEQIEYGSEVVDHRTDIYSFGIIFYEMLTGRKLRMYVSKLNIEKSFERIMENKIEPPTKFRPEIPAELNNIVMKCLEKDEKTRYQSMQELNEALRHLKRNLNITYDASNLADFMRIHFEKEGETDQT